MEIESNIITSNVEFDNSGFDFGGIPDGFPSEEDLGGWYEAFFRRFNLSVEAYGMVVRSAIMLHVVGCTSEKVTPADFGLHQIVECLVPAHALPPEDLDRLCRIVGYHRFSVSRVDSVGTGVAAVVVGTQVGGLEPRSEGVVTAVTAQPLTPPTTLTDQSYVFKCLENVTPETPLEDLALKDFPKDFDISTLKYTFDVEFEHIPLEQLNEMVNIVRNFLRWKNPPQSLKHAMVKIFDMTRPTMECITSLSRDINSAEIVSLPS